MKRLYLLTLCSLILAVGIFFLKRSNPTTIAAGDGLVIPKEWLLTNQLPVTPADDVRPADQTFLTYPEWFLVFSPEEQANYFKYRTATTFPFISHVEQIWKSYKIVNGQIKGNFPTNTGYHFMIWVIGTSASVEYAIKTWYEVIIGRITDTEEPVTAEDQFNARFTQDYVDFIKDKPWYEFDFKSRLKELWTSTSFFGDHFIRKFDRRYILTSELLVKWGYGKLIGAGTKEVYEEALPTTAVLLNNNSLVYLPRYDKFANAVNELAKKGYSFKEIAGNNSAILLTILVPSNKEFRFVNTQVLFTQPLSSNPSIRRVALTTPVLLLNTLLLEINEEGIQIEHVFDY